MVRTFLAHFLSNPLQNNISLLAMRREARKRKKQREKDAERGEGSADASEMAKDDELLAAPAPEKPEPPPEFDGEAEFRKIRKKAEKCRRIPGEPRIVLELVASRGKADSSIDDVHDNREINRRNAVTKTKMSAKIFFNGKEVCQSSSKTMATNDGFAVHFGQIFPVQIMQWPETLKVRLVESSGLRSLVLAEISLPLCEAGTTLDKVKMEPIPFKSEVHFSHDHAGIGSLVDFPTNADGSTISNEPISGQLYARVGWGKTTDGIVLSPSPNHWKPPFSNSLDPLKEVIDVDGNLDLEKLEAWIVKAQIDPNDPDNEELMNRVAEARRKTGSTGVKGAGSADLKAKNYFRLDQHSDQMAFGDGENLDKNLRYQMLQLRRMKVPEFKNYKMIPALEKEIPKGIIEAREKRVVANRKELVGSGDPVRGANRLYLEQIRLQVGHRFSLARHRRRHGDMVIEDPIPDFSTLMAMLGTMAPAQRPLRPIRTERKKVLMQDLTGQDLKLLLTVVRAYDVPVRVDHDPLQRQDNQSGSQPDQNSRASVRTYVEAKFQGSFAKTTTAEGPNPAWNQQLVLDFKSPNNDYSTETLMRIKDSLHIHLFDEFRVDLDDDEPDKSTHIHQRIEKRWLGSLSIPFSNLYYNTRIEGTFRLHSPSVLLGYDRTGTTANVLGASPEDVQGNKNATFLNIYLTIQPALMVPEPVKEKLDCDESANLVQHCESWTKEVASVFPHRKINPMVADITGKSLLMTRYFRSLKPPESLLDNAEPLASAEKVAWFVSLIPYVPSNALFPGKTSLWGSMAA